MYGTDTASSLLFVRGNSARSVDAIRAVRRACDTEGARRHSFTVVDVFNQPNLAEKYRVIATPTLLTLGGASERRLVGNLSEQLLRHHFAGERPVAESGYGY